MRPGSLVLDLSAREPSENQNSSAETGGHSDQCLGLASVLGSDLRVALQFASVQTKRGRARNKQGAKEGGGMCVCGGG